MTTGILWFRQDLRLADNPALYALMDAVDTVIPLYILDDRQAWPIGAAQQWWLHQSLEQLTKQLKRHHCQLILRHGDPQVVLQQLIQETHADTVYWNRCYEPELIRRDTSIKHHLKSKGIQTKSFNSFLLREPWEILNKQGDYFKVFTPYWRAHHQMEPLRDTYPTPTLRQHPSHRSLPSDSLNDWALCPTQPDWAGGLQKTWDVGETAAHKRLNTFIESALATYDHDRDRPDILGTSRLSPHLHFGEISPLQIWHAIKTIEITEPQYTTSCERFLTELGWREFSYHLLYHFPKLPQKNFRDAFDRFPWKDDPDTLKAWQQGQTGYPIVDAGMRELWFSGHMHNRVRMIVASFLTKDCLIDWRQGEAWFWDCLVDADLASNSASWQWTAGCGADAAPYFRIFNPILQGKKFDPNGDYVKHWIPELKHLPLKFIHQPWAANTDICEKAGLVLGVDYPKPILDHAQARQRALAYYKQLRSQH